ncbi:MAG: hypothetical protein J6S27_05530 [Thermoguttaceae bacterium]|nr:hypothetical protein [Thermoguttaceae bacterium]
MKQRPVIEPHPLAVVRLQRGEILGDRLPLGPIRLQRFGDVPPGFVGDFTGLAAGLFGRPDRDGVVENGGFVRLKGIVKPAARPVVIEG